MRLPTYHFRSARSGSALSPIWLRSSTSSLFKDCVSSRVPFHSTSTSPKIMASSKDAESRRKAMAAVNDIFDRYASNARKKIISLAIPYPVVHRILISIWQNADSPDCPAINYYWQNDLKDERYPISSPSLVLRKPPRVSGMKSTKNELSTSTKWGVVLWRRRDERGETARCRSRRQCALWTAHGRQVLESQW